jgi:NAD(P)H dehydrogenase (quinone)
MHELAEAFTHSAGRPISYVEETVEAAYASRAQFDMPRWQLDARVSTYLQVAAGELDMVTDNVANVLGRGPSTLEGYLAEHPEVLARPR